MRTKATPQTLQAMLMQIVKDAGYHPGLRLNTFATIDRFPDLRGASFGKSYQDFEASNFWSRDWAYSGADKAAVKADFPALFMEWRELELESPDAPEGYANINLYLVDKIDCPECVDNEIRTPEYLTRTTTETLQMVLRELYSFKLWEVHGADSTDYVWASVGRAEYMESQPGAPDYVAITDIGAHLNFDVIKIAQYSNLPDFRVAFTTLRFWWCFEVSDNFMYRDDIVKTLAYTKCPC